MTEKERAIEKYLGACRAVYYFNQEHDNSTYVAAYEIKRSELQARRGAFREVLVEVFEMSQFEIRRLRDELRSELRELEEIWPSTGTPTMRI